MMSRFSDPRELRQWLLVASLLIAMILVAGPTFGVYGVFFTPLLKEFALTRAQVSSLSATLFLAMGLGAPLIGWLLDRIDAKIVAVAGALISIAAFIMAARAHSLITLLIAHGLMGVGVDAACNITIPYVVANWFGARRGTALGIAFVGLAAGPMIMTIFANHLLTAVGWRDAYLLLAVPMIAVVLPIQLIFVRSRPPWEAESSAHARARPAVCETASGYEVGQALAARSFWLIVLTNFIFGFAVPGNVFFGWLGDKVRSRVALSASLASIVVAVVLLMGASHPALLIAFMAIYGIAHQGPAFMVPLTIAECLGLRRFGSLSGLIGLMTTIGGSLGPVAAGRLFDATGRYTAPLIMFVLSLALSAILPAGCVPFSRQAAESAELAAAQ